MTNDLIDNISRSVLDINTLLFADDNGDERYWIRLFWPESQVVSTSSNGLVASINSGGLQGNVEFLDDPKGTAIRVFLRGGTYGEKFRWKIHEFPAVPGTENPCSDEKIGRMYVDFTETHGPVTAGQDMVLLSNLKLIGNASILGRTLVLRSPETGRLSCAVIQPTSRIRTYQAKISTPLGGVVIVRQSGFGTGILSQLWYVNGTRRDSIHRWAILQTVSNPAESPTAIYQNEITRCANLQATPFFHISETVGYAAVGREPNAITGRTYHTVVSAPVLERVQNNLYIVIYSDIDPSEPLACGRLTAVEPRQAMAKFDSEVAGEISFRQESAFDPTLVTINLSDLNRKAYSYGIDELPLIFRGDKTEVCPNVKTTIYNPLKKSPDAVPEPSKGSADQYAVGDLSGKYGPLNNREKHFQQVYDSQLSLFGVNSIVGRAVVIYYPDGRPLACANVELSGRRVVTAFATFDFPLQGQLILRQDRDDPSADTSVYLELSYPSGASHTKTYHHPWHVNERAIPTGQRFSLSGIDCLQAGSVFNPYNVSVDGYYFSHCSGVASQRCQIGDFSGKLGYLDIPPFGVQGNKQQIARYYFTDPSLPLAGPTSVIGRSVVINEPDFGEGRLACANIFEHYSDYGK
ncbi:uncharacterized protein LOC118184725 [Stegodyphus dumicola]|uniref:uncharacterized protein LOC118184725 n=1 Tax=Stegodyphus dumicola TaxID=202533 RepID=UPI0015AEFD95|nr:uncharacterized protein LOC118184725 [Stegodyphus dumicola]